MTNYAYIDGSYNSSTKIAGYGVFLIDQNGKEHIIQGTVTDTDMNRLRNVAGEITAAEKAIELAVELGMTKLDIYYDYMGIENWATKKWKANNKYTKKYAAFVTNVINNKGLDISWIHVNAHSGVAGNDKVDILAKQAVGLL